MRYAVVFYESAADAPTRAPALFPAHKARLDEFHASGDLFRVGTFGDATQGAMAIFTGRAAAERFVEGDPFVLEGVVTAYEIRDWHEIYG